MPVSASPWTSNPLFFDLLPFALGFQWVLPLVASEARRAALIWRFVIETHVVN